MNNTSEKSRTVALLLAFFLGIWGAHRFYVGKKSTAITMLLLSITGIGLLVTGLWATIDVIIIAIGSFKDKDDYVIKNW